MVKQVHKEAFILDGKLGLVKMPRGHTIRKFQFRFCHILPFGKSLNSQFTFLFKSKELNDNYSSYCMRLFSS